MKIKPQDHIPLGSREHQGLDRTQAVERHAKRWHDPFKRYVLTHAMLKEIIAADETEFCGYLISPAQIYLNTDHSIPLIVHLLNTACHGLVIAEQGEGGSITIMHARIKYFGRKETGEKSPTIDELRERLISAWSSSAKDSIFS